MKLNAKMSERQEQGLLHLTDAMDTNGGQYMIRKMIDHALELQEIVSFPQCSPCAIPYLPHYLSLGMLKSVIKQLEMGRS